LPAACGCDGLPAEPDVVLFVGAFQHRKGLPKLLESWPEVVRLRPTARLMLIGQGELVELAQQFTERTESVDLIIDPPRPEIHRQLRRASVLVLLSQPSPSWREQVGLPITEGLAHGCAIVCSSETGLAEWLSAHGHDVLPPDATTSTVADAILGALDRGRSAASVLSDLPTVDGRLSADRWLFRSGPGSRGDRPTG
jgi:glycosyltransferase involved in cell wall biosynthesis